MGERWITMTEWRGMLRQSDDLLREAASLSRHGRSDVHVWAKLRPLNRLIRSQQIKVRGIDDREPC